MAIHNGEKVPIGELQMTGEVTLKVKNCNKANQDDLFKLVGPEEGAKLWEERKTKIKQAKLRTTAVGS